MKGILSRPVALLSKPIVARGTEKRPSALGLHQGAMTKMTMDNSASHGLT